MSTKGTWTMGIALAAILLAAATPVSAATWSYGFDNDLAEFSGTDGWVSQYCADTWTTALNGGVTPKTDDGCNVEQCSAQNNCGYNWGYWLQWGQCIQSDPLDNHITYGPKTWEDYVFRADMRNDDDDAFGFVFRYQNSGQFYLFVMTRNIAPLANLGCGEEFFGSALYRIEGSQGTVLATSGDVYVPGQVHKVQITVEGAHITVQFDANSNGTFDGDETIYDLDDPDPLPAGQVGFYAWENGAGGPNDPCSGGNCWFDNAEVDVLGVADPCDGISWEGYCEGDTAVYCSNGQVQQSNCPGCCAWIPQQEYYWCTIGDLCQQDCVPECGAGDFGCSEQGTHAWTCGQDATGCWVRTWTACSQTGVCDAATGQCAGAGPCEPQCVGSDGQLKECGPDGCGGACGTCPGASYCSPDFTCVTDCVPNCAGKMCGSDGCGGSCGDCPPGFECNQQGMCQAQCLPNCVGKQCGDDGCGGSCGVCPPGLSCVDFLCAVCTPDCTDKQCGDDGCGGLCGTCPQDFTCEDNLCVEGPCEPQCVGADGQEKQCGPNGCDGFCGFCPPGLECNGAGMCISVCAPDCNGKECGPDGCEGFCGQCGDGAICWEGQCIVQDSCEGFCGGQAPSCYCDEQCADYGDCCDDICDACPDLPTCGECVPLCPEGAQCGSDGCGGACGACDEGSTCQGHECVPDGPIIPETCGEIQGCIEQCSDDACEGACFEAAPPAAQQLYFELVQCYQAQQDLCDCDGADDNCWLVCLMEGCGGVIDECYALDGDCGDIWGCVQGCEGNGCVEDCMDAEGDTGAKLLFMELLGCAQDACPEPSPECYEDALTGACGDLFEECTGGTCLPDCDGLECGDDGCGGNCGACDGGATCIDGECIDEGDPCEIACAGKVCGSTNGCLCGTCEAGEACDDGACIPVGECAPGAYKKCVGDILYWFDSCDQQGPPTEICAVACVEDKCVDEDPGTGDVIDPEDAGLGGDPGQRTVFPKSEVSSGCTAAPAGDTSAGWLLLLALGAFLGLRRSRRRDATSGGVVSR